MDLLKCTEQLVNNQSLTQASQRYDHVSFCIKVIWSQQNLPNGGHGRVICMDVVGPVFLPPTDRTSHQALPPGIAHKVNM